MTLRPMLAHVGSLDDLNRKGYIFEPKLDGVRALCFFSGKRYSFISRNGLDVSNYFTERLPLDVIRAQSCVLDGEIVAFTEQGKPSFELLQQGRGKTCYIIFDILERNHQLFIDKPLLERKKILAETVNNHDPFFVIFFTADGHSLWSDIKKHHWEGIMAKDEMSNYRPNQRSYSWLKIKELDTIDCIIVGYHSKKRTIAALALGLYDQHKQLHYIGNVGTGFTQNMLAELEHLLKSLATTEKIVVETDVPPMIWVKPHLVAEVTYVEVTAGGKLRIPSFIRLRPDKKPQECAIKDQLKQ